MFFVVSLMLADMFRVPMGLPFGVEWGGEGQFIALSVGRRAFIVYFNRTHRSNPAFFVPYIIGRGSGINIRPHWVVKR